MVLDGWLSFYRATQLLRCHSIAYIKALLHISKLYCSILLADKALFSPLLVQFLYQAAATARAVTLPLVCIDLYCCSKSDLLLCSILSLMVGAESSKEE